MVPQPSSCRFDLPLQHIPSVGPHIKYLSSLSQGGMIKLTNRAAIACHGDAYRRALWELCCSHTWYSLNFKNYSKPEPRQLVYKVLSMPRENFGKLIYPPQSYEVRVLSGNTFQNEYSTAIRHQQFLSEVNAKLIWRAAFG